MEKESITIQLLIQSKIFKFINNKSIEGSWKSHKVTGQAEVKFHNGDTYESFFKIA